MKRPTGEPLFVEGALGCPWVFSDHKENQGYLPVTGGPLFLEPLDELYRKFFFLGNYFLEKSVSVQLNISQASKSREKIFAKAQLVKNWVANQQQTAGCWEKIGSILPKPLRITGAETTAQRITISTI